MPDSGGDALAALAAKAADATKGPWEAEEYSLIGRDPEKPHLWDGFPVKAARDDAPFFHAMVFDDMGAEATADYIASFHPGVGAALVRVAQAAKEPQFATCVMAQARDKPCGTWCPMCTLRAALADLERVLGTEETQP